LAVAKIQPCSLAYENGRIFFGGAEFAVTVPVFCAGPELGRNYELSIELICAESNQYLQE
jgi:hypothetical protein